MLVRGPSLADSMSQYLIDRIKAIGNIEVLTQTEIVALYGSREKQLERVRWRNNVNGEETEKPIRHVFCFIGAEPATGWLRDSGIALDGKNFVLTGSDVPPGARPSGNGSVVRCRWKPACAACSPPAMCGLDQSSGSEPPSARGLSLGRNCTWLAQMARLNLGRRGKGFADGERGCDGYAIESALHPGACASKVDTISDTRTTCVI